MPRHLQAQTETLSGIGEVTFSRNPRSRRIGIRISNRGNVRVNLPLRTNIDAARRFVIHNRKWILSTKARIRENKNKHRDLPKNPRRFEDDAAAVRFLSDRLEALSRATGYKYNRVAFRYQKTRWGSCSGKNNINLNVKISRLPDVLIDYVLLHELAHTRHKNHSREFWAELEKWLPNVEADRQLIKLYHPEWL